MKEIKILIVDDQKILQDGLKAILETNPEIKVISTASGGEEAILAIEKDTPDLVLMDIRMPRMNGVECTRIIKERWPSLAVLVLTTFDDEDYISDALKFGASGYLLKDISGEKLIQAVKDAYKGDTLLPSKIAAKIAGKMKESSVKLDYKLKTELNLSDREAEIAQMIAEGYTNRQIASSLYISEGTAKNYASSVYNKLGVSDRTAAVIRLRKMIE
ncbi:MAG: response regulator transcription factor [Bacillota bacterium]|nr:response regulator transcription factor [Bacillota bacterium]